MITFNATSSGSSVIASQPQEFDHTMGAGPNGIMLIITNGGVPSYNGVTGTLVFTYTPSGSYPPTFTNRCPSISAYKVVNPTPGTHTVSVPNVGGACDTSVVSYLGVLRIGDIHGVDSTSTTGSDTAVVTLSDSVTTTVDNSWVVGFATGFSSGARNYVAHSGSTLRQAGAVSILTEGVAIVDSGAAQTPAGVYSVGVDTSASSWFISMIAVELQPTPDFIPYMTII